MKENVRNQRGGRSTRTLLLSALAFTLLQTFAPASSSATDPENTGINQRDRDDKQVTAFDQGNSEADRNITASIRKAVVADDSLSMNAHNVKIITLDGVVTLRGPVDTAAEKSAVEAKAKQIAGADHVKSQLEVDTD